MKYVCVPVSASAYKNGNTDAVLTHAVELDDNGNMVRVLCKKVKLESMLDDSSQFDLEPVSCPTCANRKTKLECLS